MADFSDLNLQKESQTAAPAKEQFEPGQMVGTKYKVLSCLGSGGMGAVYLVNQVFLDKHFALKTLVGQTVSDVAVRRFQLEAKAATLLNHPNLVQVHDFGVLEDSQQPYLVMDYVEGVTLAEHLKTRGVLSVEEAGPLFAQVCFGLAYAHDQGIIHRDIKPSNIMIVRGKPWGAEGSVKVVDFGIAKLSSSDDGEIQSLTRTGEVFGSPLYMSPEQCGGGTVDRRTDVYSLGCVLYEALTGAQPHIGQTALATMMMHQSEAPLSLREASLGRDFPARMEHIVQKMLAKNPQDRYQDLAVVAHDLSRVFREVSSKQHIVKPAGTRKPPKLVSLTVAQLCSMIAATAVFFALAGGAIVYLVKEREQSGNSALPAKIHEPATVKDHGQTGADAKESDQFIELGGQELVDRFSKRDGASARQTVTNVVLAAERDRAIVFPDRSVGQLWKTSELTLERKLGEARGAVAVEAMILPTLQIENPNLDTPRILQSCSALTKSQINGLLVGTAQTLDRRDVPSAAIAKTIDEMSTWPNLQTVFMCVRADEQILQALNKCNGMRYLALLRPPMDPNLVARQPFLGHLESIVLWQVRVDPIVECLARSTRIHSLTFENGKCSPSALKHMRNCSALDSIQIFDFAKNGMSPVDDGIVQTLTQLGGLKQLIFVDIHLTPAQLRMLTRCRNLNKITLSLKSYSPSAITAIKKLDGRVKFQKN